MTMWIKYDQSPERLPVAWAGSAVELAALTGNNPGHIRSAWSDYKRGKKKDTCFARVELPDDDPELILEETEGE